MALKKIYHSVSIDQTRIPEFTFLSTFSDGEKSYPRAKVLPNQFIPEYIDKVHTGSYYQSDDDLLVTCNKKFREKIGSGVIFAVATENISLLGADGGKKAHYYIHNDVKLDVVNGNPMLEDVYVNFSKNGIARVPNQFNDLDKVKHQITGMSKLDVIDKQYPMPTLQDNGIYVDKDIWREIMLNIMLGENILLFGPTGTAKTLLGKYIGKVRKTDFEKIDFCSIKNGVSHLIGEHRIGSDGNSKFDLAVFPRVIQRPSTILMDELNRAGSDVMNILLPVLDNDKTLRMDMAPEEIPRRIAVHADARFIATANIGSAYSGTYKIDDALEDRFKMIELDYMPVEFETYFLEHKTGVKKKIAEIIVKVASTIRELSRNSQISRSLSTRGTIRIAQYCEAGFNLKDAFQMALFPYFELEEREQLKSIIASI